MRIAVTQEHIDRGERKVCNGCPVALALRNDGYDSRVEYTSMQFRIEGTKYGCETPRSVQKFILAFDKGRAVAPFSFTTKPRELVYF